MSRNNKSNLSRRQADAYDALRARFRRIKARSLEHPEFRDGIDSEVIRELVKDYIKGAAARFRAEDGVSAEELRVVMADVEPVIYRIAAEEFGVSLDSLW